MLRKKTAFVKSFSWAVNWIMNYDIIFTIVINEKLILPLGNKTCWMSLVEVDGLACQDKFLLDILAETQTDILTSVTAWPVQ